MRPMGARRGWARSGPGLRDAKQVGRGGSWGSECGAQNRRRHLGTQVNEKGGPAGVMKSKQMSPGGAGDVPQAWQTGACAWALGSLPGGGRAVPDAAPTRTAGPGQDRGLETQME